MLEAILCASGVIRFRVPIHEDVVRDDIGDHPLALHVTEPPLCARQGTRLGACVDDGIVAHNVGQEAGAQDLLQEIFRKRRVGFFSGPVDLLVPVVEALATGGATTCRGAALHAPWQPLLRPRDRAGLPLGPSALAGI
jgi:hypothetical protein